MTSANCPELERELEEERQLRERLAELLTGVANGLNGPPPELVHWDWASLPEKAARFREALELHAPNHPLLDEDPELCPKDRDQS